MLCVSFCIPAFSIFIGLVLFLMHNRPFSISLINKYHSVHPDKCVPISPGNQCDIPVVYMLWLSSTHAHSFGSVTKSILCIHVRACRWLDSSPIWESSYVRKKYRHGCCSYWAQSKLPLMFMENTAWKVNQDLKNLMPSANEYHILQFIIHRTMYLSSAEYIYMDVMLRSLDVIDWFNNVHIFQYD